MAHEDEPEIIARDGYAPLTAVQHPRAVYATAPLWSGSPTLQIVQPGVPVPPGGYGLLAQYQARGLLPYATPVACPTCHGAGAVPPATVKPFRVSLSTAMLGIGALWWWLAKD